MSPRRLGLLLGACACPGKDSPGDEDGTHTDTGTSRPLVEVRAFDVQPHTLENSRQIEVELSEPSPAALLCAEEPATDERHLIESPAATTHVFRLQGLKFGAHYRCVVGAASAPGALFFIDVGPAPSWTPSFTVETHPAHPLPDEFVLVGVDDEAGCGPEVHLSIFDTAGNLRWHHPIPGAKMGFESLYVGDEEIVYGGSTFELGPSRLHLWDGPVWSLDLPGDYELHHDAKLLPDGRVLTLERRWNAADGLQWPGFGIRTSDPLTGVVDFEYDSQQAVDAGDLVGGNDDVWHANSVDLLDHGNGPMVYVSLCNALEVLAIDGQTEQVVWTFGEGGDFALVDTDGQPLDDVWFPGCQHGLEMSDDGTRLLVYDNGRGESRVESRVSEYRIDAEARVATLLWTWTDDWRERTLGDVDRLPNGHVLVTKAHADCWSPGERSEIVEIDPATGEVWWRMSFDESTQAIYRSQRIAGCEVFSNVRACPALAARWDEIAPAGF